MRNQQIKHKAMTHYEFILGPVKIKDGLFMGDELAAKDIEFIISNKVTHVINTVVKQIPNLWQKFGIQYLSVNWTEKQQNIFDKKNNAINAIFHFIQEAMEQGESCLVHSVNGKSRACTVIVAYMMKKYNWGLDKCLEFINTKKQHLQIRNGFLIQLQQLEKTLTQIYNLSGSWQESKTEEELVLKNTFLNSKSIETHQKHQSQPKQSSKKVMFADKHTNAKLGNTLSGFNKTKDRQFDVSIKSILKEDNQNKEQCINSEQQNLEVQENRKIKENNFISNINGSIVHVTVNNFINTNNQKTPQQMSKTFNANVRPFSSDTKQRQKKNQPSKISRMFAYDNSPYDNKLITKINSNNKLLKKKQQEIKNPILNNERPQSANISGDKKKFKVINPHLNVQSKKQEMVVTGKKRYPSTNPKQQVYKWK